MQLGDPGRRAQADLLLANLMIDPVNVIDPTQTPTKISPAWIAPAAPPRLKAMIPALPKDGLRPAPVNMEGIQLMER